MQDSIIEDSCLEGLQRGNHCSETELNNMDSELPGISCHGSPFIMPLFVGEKDATEQ